MSKQITIQLPEGSADNPAPLYCKYDGQQEAQPAHIELDLRNGKVAVALI